MSKHHESQLGWALQCLFHILLTSAAWPDRVNQSASQPASSSRPVSHELRELRVPRALHTFSAHATLVQHTRVKRTTQPPGNMLHTNLPLLALQRQQRHTSLPLLLYKHFQVNSIPACFHPSVAAQHAHPCATLHVPVMLLLCTPAPLKVPSCMRCGCWRLTLLSVTAATCCRCVNNTLPQ